MADYIVSQKLINSCSKLSSASDELQDVEPMLNLENLDKCKNISNLVSKVDSNELNEFTEKLFGTERIMNKNEYDKLLYNYRLRNEKIIESFEEIDLTNKTNLMIQKMSNILDNIKELLIDMNNSIYELKEKIAKDYSNVENSQYKELVMNYKLMDNLEKELESIKDNDNYIMKKLENAIQKNKDIDRVNKKLLIYFILLVIVIIVLLYLVK
jgi:hypothetical protein